MESSGRLAIIEVKLAVNAGSRRAVAAQVPSRAGSLQGLDPGQLESAILAGQPDAAASLLAAVRCRRPAARGRHLGIEVAGDEPEDEQPRLGVWLELRAGDQPPGPGGSQGRTYRGQAPRPSVLLHDSWRQLFTIALTS